MRINIWYAKKKKDSKLRQDEFTRIKELIFLYHKPNYKMSNQGDIIQERKLNEFRFSVTDSELDLLIDSLQKLKEADESDLSV